MTLVHEPGLAYTLAEAWEDYVREHVRRIGQDERRVRYTMKHWIRIMGEASIPATWKRGDVARYEAQRLSEGAMGTTVRREMSLQQAVLNHAKKFERIGRVVHFEKPGAQGRKRRPLTIAEFQRLLMSKLPLRIRRFFVMAFWTGHRSRAIETLTWDRVNFAARTIDFNEPGARITNKRRVDGFPIPDELLRRLEAWKAYADTKAPADPYVIGLGPRGKPSTTYHECKAALRAVGIDEDGICRHTLRKTFVTVRVKRGGDMEKIAALIGDNAGTARKHYLELLTEDLRETVNIGAD